MSTRRKALPMERIHHVNRITDHCKQRFLDRVSVTLNAVADVEKTQRKAAAECQWCWYLNLGRLAGQAFTNWQCGLCGKEDSYHNTAVPKYCLDCAKAYRLCVTCGGDSELKHRTKFDRKAQKDGT